MTDEPTKLAFGYGRLRSFRREFLYMWGARLLWEEVVSGGRGLLYDRQDFMAAMGLPVTDIPQVGLRESFDAFLDLVRREHSLGNVSQSSTTALGLWSTAAFGDKVVDVYTVGSPQQSYGYLYVTQVALQPGTDRSVVA